MRHQWRHAASRDRATSRPTVIAAGIPGDRLGIHTHNDTENAVAGSLAAVDAGARQIQGTLNGLGERCGNANLTALIPTLLLKEPYASQFETGVTPEALEGADADQPDAGRNPEPGAAEAGGLCRARRPLRTRRGCMPARSSRTRPPTNISTPALVGNAPDHPDVQSGGPVEPAPPSGRGRAGGGHGRSGAGAHS